MGTRLAAPVMHFEVPEHWTRKQTARHGARVAARGARRGAGAGACRSARRRSCSATGRWAWPAAPASAARADMLDFAHDAARRRRHGRERELYIRMMPHTAAANIGIFFGMKGRVIPTYSACTSGSQAIGYAFEAIQHGSQTRMLAGGAEELCPTQAKAFDTLYATSRRNDAPDAHAAALRRRARRPGGRRRRGDPGARRARARARARRADPCRDRRLRDQQRRRCT